MHAVGFKMFKIKTSGSALSQSLVTDGCPACVNVDPILGEIPDDLSGVYK